MPITTVIVARFIAAREVVDLRVGHTLPILAAFFFALKNRARRTGSRLLRSHGIELRLSIGVELLASYEALAPPLVRGWRLKQLQGALRKQPVVMRPNRGCLRFILFGDVFLSPFTTHGKHPLGEPSEPKANEMPRKE
jgi:hypothetical protein